MGMIFAQEYALLCNLKHGKETDEGTENRTAKDQENADGIAKRQERHNIAIFRSLFVVFFLTVPDFVPHSISHAALPAFEILVPSWRA